jgi:hypothetical protein
MVPSMNYNLSKWRPMGADHARREGAFEGDGILLGNIRAERRS